MASINFQKEAYRTSENLRGSELMFGYLLPDEDVTPEERDAVQHILSQATYNSARKCTHKHTNTQTHTQHSTAQHKAQHSTALPFAFARCAP